MADETQTPEEAFQSAVDKTVVHFFALAASYRTRGRRFGLSYARIWAEAYLLFEAVYEDMVSQLTRPHNTFPIHEGIFDAGDALAKVLNAPLHDRRGVAYFDQVCDLWLEAIHTLQPNFYADRPQLTGYPPVSPELFHFRSNQAMAELPLFLIDLNGITIRSMDLETLRQRAKHLAVKHLALEDKEHIPDYRHGVEIAMFCVEQIFAEHGSMTAATLLELLEPRLEDFWVPQRSPFEETRNYPFDPADEAHYRPGHWPKHNYGL